MIACERGKTVVVEHLLKAIKIDIKAKNEKGETALMYASRGERRAFLRGSHEGHETIVEKLITAGADINAKSKDGDTALMMACLFSTGIAAGLALPPAAPSFPCWSVEPMAASVVASATVLQAKQQERSRLSTLSSHGNS